MNAFRQSGQRDDRRRRVFCDAHWEFEASAHPRRRRNRSAAWEPPVRRSENYGDGEFLDELPRLIDLVPTRLPVLLVLALVGFGMIAGLEALHAWMPDSLLAVDGRVAALDVGSGGSLAGWFASATLALAALVAVVVHSVRRHRSDDYHGRYRVWMWAALCWLLLSVEQVANLREGLGQMLVRVTGTPIYGDGSLWWIVVYGFFVGAIGTRLLVDMLPCHASAAALAAAGACACLSIACRFGWVFPEVGATQAMVAAGWQLSGSFLTLAAMVLHGRHVILDAAGLLPHRARHNAEDEAEESDEAPEPEAPSEPPPPPQTEPANQTVPVRPPYGVARPATAGLGLSPLQKPQPSPMRSVAEAEQQAHRKLTRAERKALRRRLEQAKLNRQKRAG
jgi:hypothetical protein